MKIYLSGPISDDDPEVVAFNKAVFFSTEKQLQDAGYDVVNPCRNGLPDTATWVEHMKADIKLMMDCDTLCMLPFSSYSKGAREEQRIADTLGYMKYFASELLIMADKKEQA